MLGPSWAIGLFWAAIAGQVLDAQADGRAHAPRTRGTGLRVRKVLLTKGEEWFDVTHGRFTDAFFHVSVMEARRCARAGGQPSTGRSDGERDRFRLVANPLLRSAFHRGLRVEGFGVQHVVANIPRPCERPAPSTRARRIWPLPQTEGHREFRADVEGPLEEVRLAGAIAPLRELGRRPLPSRCASRGLERCCSGDGAKKIAPVVLVQARGAKRGGLREVWLVVAPPVCPWRGRVRLVRRHRVRGGRSAAAARAHIPRRGRSPRAHRQAERESEMGAIVWVEAGQCLTHAIVWPPWVPQMSMGWPPGPALRLLAFRCSAWVLRSSGRLCSPRGLRPIGRDERGGLRAQ